MSRDAIEGLMGRYSPVIELRRDHPDQGYRTMDNYKRNKLEYSSTKNSLKIAKKHTQRENKRKFLSNSNNQNHKSNYTNRSNERVMVACIIPSDHPEKKSRVDERERERETLSFTYTVQTSLISVSLVEERQAKKRELTKETPRKKI